MGFGEIGLRHLLEDCRDALTGRALPAGRRASVLADLRSEMQDASEVIGTIGGGAVLGSIDMAKLRSATWMLSLLNMTRPDEAGIGAGHLARAIAEVESGRVPEERGKALGFLDEMLAALHGRELMRTARHSA